MGPTLARVHHLDLRGVGCAWDTRGEDVLGGSSHHLVTIDDDEQAVLPNDEPVDLARCRTIRVSRRSNRFEDAHPVMSSAVLCTRLERSIEAPGISYGNVASGGGCELVVERRVGALASSAGWTIGDSRS
jgi:hypothetical protein